MTDAHADVLAAVNASDLRKTLDATVARIEPTVTAQDACTRDMRGERDAGGAEGGVTPSANAGRWLARDK